MHLCWKRHTHWSMSQCIWIVMNVTMWHIPLWDVAMWHELLLAALGQTQVQQLLCSNKPLDHRPFQQQPMKQPAVSLEVTYGGVQTQMSTLRGTGDLLWLLLMTENPNTYGIQTQSPPHTLQIVPRMYFTYYLIVNTLTSQGYLFIHVVCTWSLNHKSINNYYKVT